MRNNSKKHAVIVVLIFLVIILGYFLSSILMEGEISEPQYEKYEQGNRLDRIRQGMKKKER